MTDKAIYPFAADSMLVLHVGFVLFVVFGLLLIYTGYLLRWLWVRNFWFRVLHLMCIAIVTLQSWAGIVCPLTTWEMSLRENAGGITYQGSFIQHWLQNLLYYSAPEWVFVLCYSVFGSMVLASWFIVRPIKT